MLHSCRGWVSAPACFLAFKFRIIPNPIQSCAKGPEGVMRNQHFFQNRRWPGSTQGVGSISLLEELERKPQESRSRGRQAHADVAIHKEKGGQNARAPSPLIRIEKNTSGGTTTRITRI